MDIEKYKEHLNTEQLLAVTTIDGPVLIDAGAGSGKTHTLTNRVAYIIDNGTTPESILLLTFTNNAAEEMRNRANKLLGYDEQSQEKEMHQIMACTYHSFCAAMLRRYGMFVDIDSNFSIITGADTTSALAFAKSKAEKKYKLRGFPQNKIVCQMFSMAINKSISIRECTELYFSKYADFVNELEDLRKDYTEYKKKHNLMDYDDLLVNFDKMLDNQRIKEVIANSYEYIMVDEYQDTNLLQARIILRLREKNHNIAVVGDVAQSIYKFRGADIRNILTFKEYFPECKVIHLKTNYRSTNQIVDFAVKSLNEHVTEIPQKSMEGTFNGTKPVCVNTRNAFDEAEYITRYIKNMKDKGYKYSNIAVLIRASVSSLLLEANLNEENIPYKKLGGLKLLEHECVQDMLSYFRVLTNPYDQLAWYRVLDIHPGIGETYAKNLAVLCDDRDFLINNQYRKREFYKELQLLRNFLNRISDMEPQVQFAEIQKFYIGVKQRKIENGNYKDEGDRTKNLNILKAESEIIDTVREIFKKYKTVKEFLDAFTLDNVQSDENDEDHVTISTIHSAKGMEWNAVFILDCIEGAFPGKNTWIDEAENQEELRCWYVAITRAKRKLYIMCPEMLQMYGQRIGGMKSHYLDNCEEFYEEEYFEA